MRIMLVVQSIGVGGAERVVTSLANEFVARGHNVCLVALEAKLPSLPLADEVQLLQLSARKSVGGLLHVLTSLRAAVRAFQPDVVHSHMIFSNIVSRVLRCLVPFPLLISTVHSTYEGGKHRMLAYSLTHRLADVTTSVSDEAVAAFERMRAVPKGQMLTVHNGIDIRAFSFSQESRDQARHLLGVEPTTRLILAVGRLDPAKNYPNLLRAIARVQKDLGWRVVIAGAGLLEAELQQQLARLGLTDQVTLLGVRRDVRDLMCAADVFVLSSDYEGFPMVVGEAMACERVVVATDCGGVAEFTGGTGILVPPRDPVALAAGLTQALALPQEVARQIGINGRERVVSLFSLDATVDRWLSLYRKNAGSNAAR